MFETPGEANVTLETLAKLAAAFKVGLKVEFVPFSEMLRWENGYSQDTFDVTRIDDDIEFINPEAASATNFYPTTTQSNQASNLPDENRPEAQIMVMTPKTLPRAAMSPSQMQAGGRI